MSKFSMSDHHAHARKSVTSLRSIMLCSPNNALDNDPPGIDSWTAEHIESYTCYLLDQVFVEYVITWLWVRAGRLRVILDLDSINRLDRFVTTLSRSDTIYKLCLEPSQTPLDSCRQDENISPLVSQLVVRLTSCPTFNLLESRVHSHLNMTLSDYNICGSPEDFRNKFLHTATRMQFSRVVEVVLRAGGHVDACLLGKTPLIVLQRFGIT